MKTERKQGGEDGTVIFEELSLEVAKRFFGSPAASVHGLLFGTSRYKEADDEDELDRNGFVTAVSELCKELLEGFGFGAVPDARIRAKDGKLDIVVWRRFADKQPGQLIGFGQCKTGTHWAGELWKLRPQEFCRKWMVKTPAVDPVRLYFIADRICVNWYDCCVDGGIVFDRCRIMEHIMEGFDAVPDQLLARLQCWVNGALSLKGLAIT